jgi:hypothetical protein
MAVNGAPLASPIRVFILGIGNGVSSAMCEGIARAGRGACFFAVDTESILGKCARLFRAGRTPFLRKVQIDWGISNEHVSSATSSVNFSIPSPSSRTIKIRQMPAIQQVPTKIQDIHAGTRTNFFVILKLKTLTVPQSITLRGELDDGSGNFELEIPIQTVQLVGAKEGLPLIHTLAAWHLIQEHQEKRAPLPQPISTATEAEMRKAVIVHLGEKYQLVSQHTSFVAVDRGRDGTQHRSWAGSFHRQDSSRARDTSDLPIENDSIWSTILNIFTGFFPNGFFLHETQGSSSQTIPGAWTDFPSSSLASPPISDDEANEDEYESVATFSTLSSLEGSTEWSDWSRPPSPEPETSEEDAQMQRSPSPNFEPQRSEVGGVQPQVGNGLPVPPPPPPPVRAEVVELVKFQLYDGSFPLHSIRGIVGANAVDEANNLQVDDAVWATVLSIAFIQKHMGSQKELMEDLLIKAREFLQERSDVDTKELLTLAKDLLSK